MGSRHARPRSSPYPACARASALRPDLRANHAPSAGTLALYRRVLARGRELTAGWGGELFVAYLPQGARVARGAPPDANARAVLESARSLGIAALDLGDSLRAQPDPMALYAYASGTAAGPAHLNERGYALVAEALHAFLRSR